MFELKLNNTELKELMSIMHDCLYAKSHEDILRIIDRLNNIIPFNAAIICRISEKNGATFLHESVNHSYPKEWMRYYKNRELCLTDPVAQASANTRGVYTWEEAYRKVEMTPELKTFIEMAEDFDLKNGVTYSCNPLDRDEEDILISFETSGYKISDLYRAIVEYIFPHIHEVVVRVDGNISTSISSQESIPALTLREKETLKWAYEGKTAWEIGVILSISERTVKFHLKNIYKKFNVVNRSQAIAKAVRVGIV